MEKNKIQMIIFLALLIVGPLIWFYPYLKGKSFVSEPIIKGYEVIDINEPNFTEDYFEAQKKLEEKRPKLEWTRNPFIMPSKEAQSIESAVSELVLSGIAVDEIGRIAIINNEIVREGDDIFGVKIIKITEDSVIVEKEGESYTLKIH